VDLWLEVLLLSVGVSVDAFAVCLAAGLCLRGGAALKGLRLPLSFGFFQFLMPLLGFRLVSASLGFLSSLDHWVGFALLFWVGLRMIRRGLEGEVEEVPFWEEMGLRKVLVFSVATSLDAFAVGMAFPSLRVPPLPTSISMGVLTASISTAGLMLGCGTSRALGNRAEVLGGAILLGLGLKVLLEHL